MRQNKQQKKTEKEEIIKTKEKTKTSPNAHAHHFLLESICYHNEIPWSAEEKSRTSTITISMIRIIRTKN